MKIEACCILEMVRAVKQMMIIPIKFSESLCYISQLACFFFIAGVCQAYWSI